MHSTDERLQRLERQNRRLTIGVVGLALLVAGLLLTGVTVPDESPGEIKATSFVLLDSCGHERATLREVKGNAVLVLRDTLGNQDVLIRAADGGGLIRLPSSDNRSGLLLTGAETAKLLLWYGSGRLQLHCDQAAGPEAIIRDKLGRVTWSTTKEQFKPRFGSTD